MERGEQRERIWMRLQSELAGRKLGQVILPEGFNGSELQVPWRGGIDAFAFRLEEAFWELDYQPLGPMEVRRRRLAELWPKQEMIGSAFGEPIQIRPIPGPRAGALHCRPRAGGVDQPMHFWPAMVDSMLIDLARLRSALEAHVFAWSIEAPNGAGQ
jgi:hypothetical protein